MRRARPSSSRLLAAATVLAGSVPAQAATPAEPADERRVIGRRSTTGRSWRGTSARSTRPVQLVVIGQLHGNEPGGRIGGGPPVADGRIPDGVGLWLITSVNPDGARAGTRVNARGVDLNRNFPDDWRSAGRRTDQWSGPRAASEPETRAVVRFLRSGPADGRARLPPGVRRGRHQPPPQPAGGAAAGPLDGGAGRAWCGCTGPCHGTMTQWVDAELGAIALTVELDRRVSGAEADRAAAAVLRLGQWLGR